MMKHLMKKPRKSKKSLTLILLMIVVIFGLYFFVGNERSSNEEIAPRLGFYAPNFKTVYLNGSEFELYKLRGKPVVLNFWATWCPPCIREMPDLQAFYDGHKGEVIVIGVNLGEKNRTIQNFIKRINVTFPIVLDKDKEIEKSYNLIIRPTTYFIDEKGVIVDKKLGELKKGEIEERAQKLLK